MFSLVAVMSRDTPELNNEILLLMLNKWSVSKLQQTMLCIKVSLFKFKINEKFDILISSSRNDVNLPFPDRRRPIRSALRRGVHWRRVDSEPRRLRHRPHVTEAVHHVTCVLTQGDSRMRASRRDVESQHRLQLVVADH